MKPKIFFSLFALAIGAAFVLFSGGHVQAGSTAPRARAAIADTNIDWDKMSHADKKQYMKDVVLPKMGPLMHNFDPKRFKDVKCVTCHGVGALDGTYKMPNPKLPKLPATREGFQALGKKMPAIMKFMSDTMKPVMADLLGMKPFDPQTRTGFSCGNCHTNEKK